MAGNGELFFLKMFEKGNYLFFVEGVSESHFHIVFSCNSKFKLKPCQWLESSRLGY